MTQDEFEAHKALMLQCGCDNCVENIDEEWNPTYETNVSAMQQANLERFNGEVHDMIDGYNRAQQQRLAEDIAYNVHRTKNLSEGRKSGPYKQDPTKAARLLDEAKRLMAADPSLSLSEAMERANVIFPDLYDR